MATPKGLASRRKCNFILYGQRKHPKSGEEHFHNGIDVSALRGNPVTVAADGIVSFSGWNGGSGNLVVVGAGSDTQMLYAHSKMNAVKVGQRVPKKGDAIACVGSTGNTTGSIFSHEVWKNGSPVNPKSILKGGISIYVFKKHSKA